MTNLNGLTRTEHDQFSEQGYLLLRSVLSPSEVASLLVEVERLVDDAGHNGDGLHEPYYHKDSYKIGRALKLSSAFDGLIDHPCYFGKIVSLMGTYIQVMAVELFVRGVADCAITGFHTDMGPGMQAMIYTPGIPLLELKTQVFLTDLSKPDSSNFALFPGSHRWSVPDSNPLCMIDSVNGRFVSTGELPDGAIQILAEPGDVLLFPHSLWHSVAPNRSGRTRYSISFRYGQLALRPMERFDPVMADPLRALTPRQRRLLGDLGDEAPSPYRPPHQREIMSGG